MLETANPALEQTPRSELANYVFEAGLLRQAQRERVWELRFDVGLTGVTAVRRLAILIDRQTDLAGETPEVNSITGPVTLRGVIWDAAIENMVRRDWAVSIDQALYLVANNLISG